MSEDETISLIPYDEIVQDALRAVVGRVLREVADGGGVPPGEHHFYVSFRTTAPGVQIPPHLRAKYPTDMTIVLQNQFHSLDVEEERFSVGLSFGGVPAKLVIPFAAVTQFHDPAVEFALQFQVDAPGGPEPHEAGENDEIAPPVEATPVDDGSNVVAVDFSRKK